MTPKRGFKFRHSRILEESGEPMLYEVTRAAQGKVYYRPVGGGGSEYCEEDHFHKIAGLLARAEAAEAAEVRIAVLEKALEEIADKEPGTEEWVGRTEAITDDTRLLGEIFVIARSALHGDA